MSLQFVCPKCNKGDRVDVSAMVWVRLLPDGAEVSPDDGSMEFDRGTVVGRYVKTLTC